MRQVLPRRIEKGFGTWHSGFDPEEVPLFAAKSSGERHNSTNSLVKGLALVNQFMVFDHLLNPSLITGQTYNMDYVSVISGG
jgi:hypothetical protein